MNKREVIEALSGKTGLPKSEAQKAVHGIIDIMTEALANGEDVSLLGFGAIQVVRRSARSGRNPKTGIAMNIPARNGVRFRVGVQLAKAVNRK